jgi:LysR family transcriptional regulator, hydrogen peroxide-inducible genes activator
MEMQQIVYFRALCDELNFTRAAERCKVSQPSLTRSIKNLEEEFGGALFHRERSNTHLSELGRIVKPHLDEVFNQTQAAAHQAQSFRELEATRLKLGIMCTIAPTDLVSLLGAVRTRHPGIQLELRDGAAAEMDVSLRNGELEVAIFCKAGEERDPGFHYMPLFRERFVVAVAEDHALAKLKEVRAPDLIGTPYLRRTNCEYGDFARTVFNGQGLFNKVVYSSDRDDWILAMASAGMGYSFMPERCARQRGVVAKPLVDPEFWREVSLVTVRGRPHSPAVGALLHEAMLGAWSNGRALAVRQWTESEKVG